MPVPDDAGYDEPLVPGETVEDASLLRRFAVEYRGPHDAEDAFWWLAHPADPGPSGAASPLAALQPLRAALYRSGAGAAEVDAHRQAEEAIRADRRAAWTALQAAVPARAVVVAPETAGVPSLSAEEVAEPAGSGRRALIVVTAALGLALVVGGGFVMFEYGSPAHITSTPRPTTAAERTMTVHAVASELEGISAKRLAQLMAAAFMAKETTSSAGARRELTSATDLALDAPSGIRGLGNGGRSEDGSARRVDIASVREKPTRFGGGGTLQVRVMTERRASWTWRVIVENRSTRRLRTAFVVLGAEQRGRLQSLSLHLATEEVPAGMRLSVTPRTPYLWDSFYLY